MKLEVGKSYEVKVDKILPFGAVLKFEDNSTELLHISNITEDYVKDVSDYLTVGDMITVDCIEGTVKDLELTTKGRVDKK